MSQPDEAREKTPKTDDALRKQPPPPPDAGADGLTEADEQAAQAEADSQEVS